MHARSRRAGGVRSGSILAAALAAGLLAGLPAEALARGQSEAGVGAPGTSPGAPSTGGASSVLVRDRAVADLLEELLARSPTAARLLAEIREAGLPLTLGTFADLTPQLQREYRSWDPRRRRAVGYTAPILRRPPGGERARVVHVVVALDLVRIGAVLGPSRVAASGPGRWRAIRRTETLAVLAHELVHAWGLAVARDDPERRCRDPGPGEDPSLSCVVVGENVIRRELGAPLDWGYGMPSPEGLAARYAERDRRDARLRSIAARTAALRLGS